MTNQMIRILLIEDDSDYAAAIRARLVHSKSHHFEVQQFVSLQEAILSLQHSQPDVIFLDLSLPDSQGIDSLTKLQDHVACLPIIVLTGVRDETLALEAIKRGAEDYLIKGEDDVRILERVIFYAIERKHAEEILLNQQQENQAIFDAVPALIWHKDKENRILRVNKTAAAFMGFSVEQIEGRLLRDFYPEDAEKHFQDDLDVICSGKPKYGIIEKFRMASGDHCWVRMDKLPHRDEKGNIAGVIVFAIDITERKRTEDHLRESERRLRRQSDVLIKLAKSKTVESGDLNAIIKEITEASAETLEVGRVSVWFYDAARKKMSCTDLYELLADHHTSGMDLVAEKYPNYFEALENFRFIDAANAHTDSRTCEFSESYLYPLGITSLLDSPIRLDGKIVGVLCHEHMGHARQWTMEEKNFAASMADLIALAMESCERKRAEERLNHLAYYDPLTDLPNRVLFIDRLNQAMITARRYQKLVGVLFLDLDHFKRINDTLGHAVGDELLQAVAVRLKKALYETDTLTRNGGDEFIILLPGLEKVNDTIKVAEKIYTTFKLPFMAGGQELYITASMGIAIFPNDGIDNVTLLKNADTAMYQAKEKGRNNYRLYSSSMSVKAFERLILENNLRRALEKNELLICYQPQIDLETREIVSVEALVRWQHPSLGLVGPNEFIPIAEETGLIIPIGEWVMREACRQSKQWQDAGYRPICVSVNLSDRQFDYADLCGVVERVLVETGLDAKYLELELTESMIMHNLEETVVTLGRLKKMGVRISIDDFGTGHSSLTYLKRFPIDCLKIDRSFINDVAQNADDAAIARAIISMAHNLKLKVVAEGVETGQQIDFLHTYHCDLVQGHFFSKAVVPDEVIPYLIRDEDTQNQPSVA